MRILHIIKHCCASNGNVNVAVDLACVHARDGHVVTFVSGGGTYVELLEAHGVRHVTLKQQGSPMTVLRSLVQLVALCRRLKPQLIHAHMMSSATLGFVAARLSGVPLITTVHNSFDRHSALMRLGDAVVAVSDAERRLLLTRGYADRKLAVIRNGPVGSPRERSETAGSAAMAKPCIVTVAGLHARKGVDHLIDAFALTAPANPAWHLNIIGEGPDHALLEARVANLNLQSRVHFIGSVPSSKSWLEQADVFVLASLAEPGGLVLGEARAAGCAIVATRVGGNPELLDDGEAGQLVPPADPQALAETLGRLMQDGQVLGMWRARSGRNAEGFKVGSVAGRYLDLYRRVAAAA